jgi:FG-GAP-like repeat
MDVFLNDGTGKLMPLVAYDSHGADAGVAVADLNGDGVVDVITANDRSYAISVQLGQGNGTFVFAKTYPAGNTHAVAVVDLDLDGKLDVVSASFEDTKLSFYRGTGDGAFVETAGIEAAPVAAEGLVTADFQWRWQARSGSHGRVSRCLSRRDPPR